MANDTSGIMALPMTDQQPAPAAPDAQMVFDSMRQNLSSKEVSDELLASGAQTDPQAVAEFKAQLDELDVPPEILDLINQLIDEVLANPQGYEQIRQKYLDQGVSEDMLPEQFEPEFFAALNIAVDQLRGEPAGPQAFANGGIAELKPVAQAIASYGRNGDTMLAHITPAEARMLKKRGGSGTINPVTGLPEFANIFSKIASAGKSFLRSTAGRMIATIALGALIGPAAAAAMGVGAGTAAGIAISGFVGSAGSTLLAGGNIRDALRAGAIGGLVAGAGAAAFGDVPLTGEATMTPGEAFQSQLDKAGNVFKSAPVQEAAPVQATAPTQATAPVQPTAPALPPSGKMGLEGLMPSPTTATPGVGAFGETGYTGPGSIPAEGAASGVPSIAPVAPPATVGAAPSAVSGGTATGAQIAAKSAVPTVGESISKIGEGLGMGQGPAEWSKFKEGVSDLFMPKGASQQQIMDKAIDIQKGVAAKGGSMSFDTAMRLASKDMVPTALRSYGPMAAAGLGIMGLAGGFKSQPAAQSPLYNIMMGGPGSASDLLRRNPGQYYVQGLPGVGYVGGRPGGYAEGGMADAADTAYKANTTAAQAKTLTAQQKTALANLLAEARKTGVYDSFNRQIATLQLNKADFLRNFPEIPAEALDAEIAKGARVVPDITNPKGGTYSPYVAYYFAANPDVQKAYETQVKDMTPEEYVQFHWNKFGSPASGTNENRQGYYGFLAPGYEGEVSDTPGANESIRVPTITPTTNIGTPAVTDVEVASPTLRGTALPTDARSVALRGKIAALGENPSAEQIAFLMDKEGISPASISQAFNLGLAPTQAAYYNAINAGILGGYRTDPMTGKRTPVLPDRTVIAPPTKLPGGALPVSGPAPALTPPTATTSPAGGTTTGGGIASLVGGTAAGGTTAGGTAVGGTTAGGTAAGGTTAGGTAAGGTTAGGTAAGGTTTSGQPLITTTPAGQRVSFGPNATVIGQDVSNQIQAAYRKAGLPEDPRTWTLEHRRIATDINNEIQQFGPYDKLIFDPKTGGVDRPDPQLFATLEPERKAAAEAYLKAALPNAVGLVRTGTASQGAQAIERLLKDYRLSLDQASAFLSPEDAAALRREVEVGNIRYAEPGRATYYGAIQANAPGEAFLAGIGALGKGRPGAATGNLTDRDLALRQLLATYTAEQGSDYLKNAPMPFLTQMGVPDWVWKYGPSFEDVFKAESSGNPDEYWQKYAREKVSQGQQTPALTVLDRVGGVPIYRPINPNGTPSVGSSYGDVRQLQRELGFTPQEVIATEAAYNKYGLGSLANQIDPQIANAVRDSVQAGYTMDQVYEGAQRNMGISKERVDQALKAMNMYGGSKEFKPEDVPGFVRTGLSTPAATQMTIPDEPTRAKALGISNVPGMADIGAAAAPTSMPTSAPASMAMPAAAAVTTPAVAQPQPELQSGIGSLGTSFVPPAASQPDLIQEEELRRYRNPAMMGQVEMLSQGGYPRRTGQIDGPGTATSDSIPAMLSDGEFVMTAKAVRGLGNGSRREGAKKMYALMHRLEKNAARA